MRLINQSARQQGDPGAPAYDRWTSPWGGLSALFFRRPEGFMIRFPDKADFVIDVAAAEVHCFPISDSQRKTANGLFENAIVPLLGNHAGGLYLHASAVVLPQARAIAFAGVSRRGKSTTAAAFARAGYPYLSEDVLRIERTGASYVASPSRPVIRLMDDSAVRLMGQVPGAIPGDDKVEFATAGILPFATTPTPLAAFYLLGPGTAQTVEIAALPPHLALAELMQHAFVLDVEDKARLARQFTRIGDLCAVVPCFRLDFPRSYAHLPQVIDTILRHARDHRSQHDT